MNWTSLWLKCRALIFRTRVEHELKEELDFHAEMQIRKNLQLGMTQEEARRQARIKFGSGITAEEECRNAWGVNLFNQVRQDLSYAVRIFVKNPGFTLVAVLTLALGIGANTVMFSVVNAVVLRPLAFPNSERLMRVWHVPPPRQFPGTTRFPVSPANYLDWKNENDVFTLMTIYQPRRLTLTGISEPESVRATAVSAEFFDVFGVKAILGRVFASGEDEPGHDRLVVLSESLWRSRFGADTGIVGRSIVVEGEPRTVIGIVPRAMAFPTTTQLWVPLAFGPKERVVRGIHDYLVIARVKPNVGLARAQAEMTTISHRLEEQYPADDAGWGAVVVALQDDIVGDTRAALLILLGAVGFVMLIAVANVANLLLARTVGRSKEIALRTALGAARRRIVQQVLCETTLLGVMGGIAGLLLARSALLALVALAGPQLPRADEINLDGRVLAFTFIIAVATGVIAGLVPAWRLTRTDPNDALKQGDSRIGCPSSERRMRHVLAVSEVAVALMLLVGAGLLIRSLAILSAVDPGIDPHNLLTMSVSIPRAKYPKSADWQRFFDRVLQRIQVLPDVDVASAIDFLPLEGGSTQPAAIEGQPSRPMAEQPEVAVRRITPSYPRTTGMRLLAGRDFTDADTVDRPAVVLISESMARQFWPNESAISRHLTLTFYPDVTREVVGIVADVKLDGLDKQDPLPAVYMPLAQAPGARLTLLVRTRVPPERVGPATTAAIHEVDADQPVNNVLTMDDVIGLSVGRQRFAMRLLGGFAALGLLLAAIGIYGVLSYTVRQRVREIGIRMALGASAGETVALVLQQGIILCVIGISLGLAGAMAVTRYLSKMLFGLTPLDPITFISAATIFIFVGIVASYLPARRATRVDPLVTLRYE